MFLFFFCLPAVMLCHSITLKEVKNFYILFPLYGRDRVYSLVLVFHWQKLWIPLGTFLVSPQSGLQVNWANTILISVISFVWETEVNRDWPLEDWGSTSTTMATPGVYHTQCIAIMHFLQENTSMLGGRNVLLFTRNNAH